MMKSVQHILEKYIEFEFSMNAYFGSHLLTINGANNATWIHQMYI